jgi:hypothetical protein
MNELIRAVMRLKAPVRVLAGLILLANSFESRITKRSRGLED